MRAFESRQGVLIEGLVASLLCSGCGTWSLPRAAASDLQVREYESSATRCTVAITKSEPLVTEWPASSKARLEALLNETVSDTERSAVAVRYTGCELRIIDECRPQASYDWSKTTLARDAIEIQDSDDLYAKLPLGAASLEGTLKRMGHLTVQTTVAGQIKVRRASVDLSSIAKSDACLDATHIVAEVTIGAFKMTAGGHGQAGASAGFGNAGAGASFSRQERILREAGSDKDCVDTTDEKPKEGCRSPLQLYLLEIPNRQVKSTILSSTTWTTAVTQEPTPKSSTLRTVSYILGGLGLGSLGAGGSAFAVSGNIGGKIQSGDFANGQQISDAYGSMSTSRTLGFAGLISGGVLLGLAVPFFIAGRK